MTSYPAYWQRSVRHDVRVTWNGSGAGIPRIYPWGGFNPPFYIGKTLAGVAWPCPSCGGIDSVVLSVRKRRQFKFECTKRRCGWGERYSFFRAFELLDEIAVARP